MKRALISVSDKTDIVAFAQQLVELDYNIISTGGTLQLLRNQGVPAEDVENVTGFPEMLDGRVKTLHPYIHGGILAERRNDDHVQSLEKHNIIPIDLVVVNLYPFKETLLKEDVSEKDIIENIDIGGPAMLRASAKNFQDVTVVVDPTDYDNLVEAISKNTLDYRVRKEF